MENKLSPLDVDSSKTTVFPKQNPRHMVFLTVHQNELTMLSLLNTHISVFSSVGSFVFSFLLTSVGLLATWDSLLPIARIAASIVAPISAGIAALCFALAWFNRQKQNEIMATIEKESELNSCSTSYSVCNRANMQNYSKSQIREQA